MHLRSITMKGFKSFPHRTKLEFSPGVGVVVGPNGSGKSNITDAVLWALGEQSPLAVRGQTMKDVIFAGRPRRQRAPARPRSRWSSTTPTARSDTRLLRDLDRPPARPRRRGRVPPERRPLPAGRRGRGAVGHRPRQGDALGGLPGPRRVDRALQAARPAPADRGGRRPRQAPQAPPPRAAQARAHRGEPVPRARRGARGALAAAPAQAPGRGRAAARAPRSARATRPRYELSRDDLRSARCSALAAGRGGGRRGAGRSATRPRPCWPPSPSAARPPRRRSTALARARGAAGRGSTRLARPPTGSASRLERARDQAAARAARAASGAGPSSSCWSASWPTPATPPGLEDAHGRARARSWPQLEGAPRGARERGRWPSSTPSASRPGAPRGARAAPPRCARGAGAGRGRRRSRALPAPRGRAPGRGAPAARPHAPVRSWPRQPVPAHRRPAAHERRRRCRLQLDVEPGYETALAAALGSRLRAGVVADGRRGRAGARRPGRTAACVLVAGVRTRGRRGRGGGTVRRRRVACSTASARSGPPRRWPSACSPTSGWSTALDDVADGFCGVAVTRDGRVSPPAPGELRQAPAGGPERAARAAQPPRGARRRVGGGRPARGRGPRRARGGWSARGALPTPLASRPTARCATRTREVDEAAEAVRSAGWLMERRREAPDEGPDAVRRAELSAEVRAERRVAEGVQREHAERERRVERLRRGCAARRPRWPARPTGPPRRWSPARDAVAATVAARSRPSRLAGAEAGERTAAQLRACAHEEAELQARLREASETRHHDRGRRPAGPRRRGRRRRQARRGGRPAGPRGRAGGGGAGRPSAREELERPHRAPGPPPRAARARSTRSPPASTRRRSPTSRSSRPSARTSRGRSPSSRA